MKVFLAHVLRILETLWTGSISFLYRCVLSVYLLNIFLLFALGICTWLILSALFNFFRPLRLRAARKTD
jgi:hypothetical protein